MKVIHLILLLWLIYLITLGMNVRYLFVWMMHLIQLKRKYLSFLGGNFSFPSNPFVIDITNFNESFKSPHGHEFFVNVYDDDVTNENGSIQSICIEFYDKYDTSGHPHQIVMDIHVIQQW